LEQDERNKQMIWVEWKEEYFWLVDWTDATMLIPFVEFRFV
jgi:hypothetical protein